MRSNLNNGMLIPPRNVERGRHRQKVLVHEIKLLVKKITFASKGGMSDALAAMKKNLCELENEQAQLISWMAQNTPAGHWVMLTKRTDDPKLAWMERKLKVMGIPTRRNGQSFHAPILEVPAEHEQAAWAWLDSIAVDLKTAIDDLPDDHPTFNEEG